LFPQWLRKEFYRASLIAFTDIGMAPSSAPRDQQTPDALAALHKAEIKKWWPTIKAAGMKIHLDPARVAPSCLLS
jgi:hypothetical protein